MTDSTTPPVPSLLQQIVRALMQKGLTALATLLVTHGVFASNQTDQFVSLGISVGLWALSFGWTYFHEKHDVQAKVALANAPAADPPLSVPVK